MKHLFALIFSFLTVFLFVSSILAFQPGPYIIRECPKCKAELQQATTVSGNTFHARFWTDGRMVAPMLPDRPRLVKCPECNTLFWIDEAKKLGEQPFLVFAEDDEWPNAIFPNLPTESDYLSLLNGTKLTKNMELYLRQRVWWASNDEVRQDENATIIFSSAQEANLRALANLLDEKIPDERIMKAEIFRELKEYDNCIKLLTEPFENDHHTNTASFIKKLAEEQVWRVYEIKEEEKPDIAAEDE